MNDLHSLIVNYFIGFDVVCQKERDKLHTQEIERSFLPSGVTHIEELCCEMFLFFSSHSLLPLPLHKSTEYVLAGPVLAILCC